MPELIQPKEPTAERKYNLQLQAIMKTKVSGQEAYGDKMVILDTPGKLSEAMAAMDQNIKMMQKQIGKEFEQPIWFVGAPEPQPKNLVFIGWIAKTKIKLDKD